MKRVLVCTVLNGATQFYKQLREAKDPRTRASFSQPYFVLEPREAQVLGEDVARSLVRKLRIDFNVADVWLEDVDTGEHILVGQDGVVEPAKRTPKIATLDDENDPNARWYVIKPADTPQGPRWFIHVKNPRVPGEPTPVYADDPLAVLEKVKALGWMSFIEHARYIPPAPAATQPSQSNQPRLRPGSWR